jgi:hypothetical protein
MATRIRKAVSFESHALTDAAVARRNPRRNPRWNPRSGDADGNHAPDAPQKQPDRIATVVVRFGQTVRPGKTKSARCQYCAPGTTCQRDVRALRFPLRNLALVMEILVMAYSIQVNGISGHVGVDRDMSLL